VIITRANDRRLRLSATDWVKNGDRWTITRIGRWAHRPAQPLPAQGVSADTMHGLVTGQESRQQLSPRSSWS
jgi:hypothetical protein